MNNYSVLIFNILVLKTYYSIVSTIDIFFLLYRSRITWLHFCRNIIMFFQKETPNKNVWTPPQSEVEMSFIQCCFLSVCGCFMASEVPDCVVYIINTMGPQNGRGCRVMVQTNFLSVCFPISPYEVYIHIIKHDFSLRSNHENLLNVSIWDCVH